MADQQLIESLKRQILASSDPTKWTGEGKGSASANAEDMANILSSIGITDISQFGKWTTPDYKAVQLVQRPISDDGGATEWGYYSDEGGDSPVWKTVSPETAAARDENGLVQIQVGTKDVYGNTLTKQAVGNTYGERQVGNAFGGTYSGEGNTGYRVAYDAQGNPHFYTSEQSSSSADDVMPLLMIGSMALGLPGLLGSAVNTGLGLGLGAAGTAALGGATLGGLTAAATGGDIGKGILLGGVGGYAGSTLGDMLNAGVTDPNLLQAAADADMAAGMLPEFGTNAAYDAAIADLMAGSPGAV